MINTKILIGIFALLFSFSVFAADIDISDAWIRPTTQGHENGMVGLILSTPKKIKIVAVSSPAYTTAEIRKLRKTKSEKEMETLNGVSLSANKTLVFGPDSIHLALIGSKNMLNAGDKVPVILTVEFENKKTLDIKFFAQPVRLRAGGAPLPSVASLEQRLPRPVENPATPKQMQIAVEAVEPVTPPAPLVEDITEAIIETPIQIPVPVISVPLAPVVKANKEPKIKVAKKSKKSIPVAVISPTVETASVEPIIETPAPQPTPEIVLTKETDDVIPPVEDCIKYSAAINACNQEGELDEIMRCRKKTKLKLTCS